MWVQIRYLFEKKANGRDARRSSEGVGLNLTGYLQNS